ncbi:MAG: sulfur carrier protein ThiS [Patescibacteria group bacterium]
MNNRGDGLFIGKNPIANNNRTDPLRTINDEDEARFNNQELLCKAQKNFFEMTIESINIARVKKKQTSLASKFSRLTRDGYVSYLLENINWSLHQENQQQALDLFRRLRNNFFLITQSEIHGQQIIIKILESLLFELCLREYPNIREKLVIVLFDFDKLLAQKIDQTTQPAGLIKIAQVITGKTVTLIGHNEETGRLQLQLEHQSGQLLLTGPTQPDAKITKQIFKPQYPGHISNPESIATNIDHLVKSGFDIFEGLSTSQKNNKEVEALGQLFTALCHIIDDKIPLYAITDSKEAKKSLKPFKTPQRVKDERLNIFGNILMACIKKHPELKKTITNGVNKLAQANSKIFESLEIEFFFEQRFKKETQADNIPKPQAGKPNITNTKPSKPVELIAREEDFSTLEPLDRLEKIYLSNSIDFRQLADYDPYARGVLSLILCGKKNPLPEELTAGYRKWQQLVHPDKTKDEMALKFSKLITGIGTLSRKQEFIREEACQAVTELFELVKQLFETHSVTIIPRQGYKRIVFSEITIKELLARENNQPEDITVVFHGQVVDSADFEKVKLKSGDTVEIVTF